MNEIHNKMRNKLKINTVSNFMISKGDKLIKGRMPSDLFSISGPPPPKGKIFRPSSKSYFSVDYEQKEVK